MSREIDERVVSMQFDNKHFERNVQTSLSTLEKLKQSLKLKDASKGLENVSAAAKKFDMSSMCDSVDKVGLRFSALYTIADQTLRNIVNSVERCAKNIVSSFTIEPVKSGFEEYETQINSVQTIMSNVGHKGKTLDDVNAALDELNLYADRTIYNFTEMTRNIGLFVNAGVGLDESVSAIKGFSNAAAMAGTDATRTAGAMYQLSQAMSSGSVKLMDWRSLEQANITGQRFQDTIIETARAHGIAIDDMIKKEGSLRETLSSGWLTADLMSEALNHYTLSTETMTEEEQKANRERLRSLGYTEAQIDKLFALGTEANNAATKVKTFTQLMGTLKEAAQSGWSQSWRLIIGDFEEAKTFFTELSDKFGKIIGDSADDRNKLLEGALTSNWDRITEKVNESGASVEDFEKTLKETINAEGYDYDELIKKHDSLSEIFKSGAVKSDVLKKALDKLNISYDGTGKTVKKVEKELTYTVKKGDNLWSIAKKYDMTWYELWKLNKDIIKNPELIFPGQVLKTGAKTLEETTEKTEKQTESWEELIDNVNKRGGRELLLDSLMNAIDGVIKACSTLKKSWREVFPKMSSDDLYKIIEAVHKFSEKLVMSEETTKKVGRALIGLFNGLKVVKAIIGGGVTLAFRLLKNILGGLNVDVLEFAASIGDAITKFSEWLLKDNKVAKWFDDLGVKMGKGIGVVRDWINAFIKLPEVQKILADIKTGFSDIWTVLKGKFAKSGEVISAWWKRVTKLEGGLTFDNIKTALTDFKKNVVEFFTKGEDGSSIFDGLIDAFSRLKDKVVEHLGLAGVKLDEFWTKTKDVFKKLGQWVSDLTGNLLALGIVIGTLVIIGKIASSLNKIAGAFEGFGGVMEGLEKTLKAIAFKTRMEAIGSAMESLGKTILMFAAALFVISKIPSENLTSSVIAMGAIMVLLAGLTFVLTKMGDLKDTSKMAISIISLSIALAVLAKAAKTFGDMDLASLAKAGVALGILLLAIKQFTMLFSETGVNFAGFGKTMLALSGALIIMAMAVNIFGHMKVKTLTKGLLGILGCMTLLTAFIFAITGIQKITGQSQIIKFGGMMLALSGALLVFSMAISIFGHMKSETLKQGLISILGCMTLLSAFIFAITGIQKITGQSQIIKFGGMMLALSGALTIMAVTVAIFGKMDYSTLIQGGIAVSACMTLLAMFLTGMAFISKIVKPGEIVKFGGTMLALGGALLIMTASVAILGMLETSKLTKGIIAVGLLSAFLSALLFCSKFASGVKMGPIIALAAAVGVLAIALAALSFVDPTKLMASTVGLSMVMGMFTLMSAAAKSVNMKTLATIAIMTAAVGALGYILYKLSDIPADTAMAVAGGLSILIASLSASCLILAGVGSLAGPALAGIGVLAVLIALVGVVAAIGISSLPTIGAKLAEFMTNVTPFIDGAKNIDRSMLDGVKTLAEIFLILTGASLLDRLTGNKSLANFGSQLKSFAKGLSDFSDVVTGENFDSAAITRAADAARALVDLQNALPETGGLKQWITGVKDIGDFGDDLTPFADGLSKFNDTVTDKKFNAEAVKSAAGAAKELVTAVDGVPETGGLKQLVTGAKDIGDFGEDLVEFTTGLSTFNNAVTDKMFDAEKIKSAAGAAKELITATDGIPETGGLKQWINGSKDLGDFGGTLASFAVGLSIFNDTVTDKTFNSTAVKSAAEAAKELITATNGVPETGGLKQLITGAKDVGDFGSSLGQFMTGLVAFNDAVTDKTFNSEKIKSAAEAAKELITATNGVSETGGLKQLITGVKDVGDFGSSLVPFINGLVAFNDAVTEKTFNAAKIKSAAEAAKELITATNGVSETGGLKQLITGAKDVGNFSTDLGLFTTGLVAFNDAVVDKTFDSAKIKSAAEAAKELITATNGIPETSGLKQLITGSKDLGNFSVDIVTFASGLTAFNDAVTGKTFDVDAVKAAAGAAKELVTATADIPESGGLKQLITGTSSIENFGTKLGTLGSGLAEFSKSVTGDNAINTEAVTAAVNAISGLATIANELPKTESLWDLLADDGNLADFGTEVGKLGEKIKGFSDSVYGINLENVTAAVGAVESLSSLAETVGGESKIGNLWYAGSTIDDFGKKISKFYTSVEKVDATKMSTIATALTDLASITTDNTGALSSFVSGLSKIGSDGVDAFLQAFSDAEVKALDAGSKLLSNLVTGVKTENETNSPKAAFTTILVACVEEIRNSYTAFYDAGKYVASGFAAGIEANTFMAAAKAAAMASAAIAAAQAKLIINSPSKVFRKMGMSVPEGFAMGIDKLKGMVTSSSVSMAETAIDGAKRSLSRVVDAINSDIDAQPTIRPVLDLSDIRSGAGRITGLFGDRPSIRIGTNVGSIAASMNSRQNGNDDVVSAIKDLGRKVANTPSNTYQINGITYDDGSNISSAVQEIVRAARIERRR